MEDLLVMVHEARAACAPGATALPAHACAVRCEAVSLVLGSPIRQWQSPLVDLPVGLERALGRQ